MIYILGALVATSVLFSLFKIASHTEDVDLIKTSILRLEEKLHE